MQKISTNFSFRVTKRLIFENDLFLGSFLGLFWRSFWRYLVDMYSIWGVYKYMHSSWEEPNHMNNIYSFAKILATVCKGLKNRLSKILKNRGHFSTKKRQKWPILRSIFSVL